MDIFAMAQSLRRHWRITVVVAALTAMGAVAALFLMPRHYEATASYVLVNPAPAPSSDEIAADPDLGKVNRNNPYLRFANPATVGQVLAGRVSSDSVRAALEKKGADANYTIGPSADFGGTGQVMDLTGTGSSGAQAELTLRLVADSMNADLRDMQKVYGADDSDLITALPVAAPTSGHAVLSGTVRALVGFLGAGVLLLFTSISVAEARQSGDRRGTRRRPRPASEVDGQDAVQALVPPVPAPAHLFPHPTATRPAAAEIRTGTSVSR